MLTAILLVLPSAFSGEHTAALKPPDFVVRSAVEINAPPEVIWHQVIAFSEIPPPQELLFRAASPIPPAQKFRAPELASSVFAHTVWPATYWSWWSNYVIHRIHMRVLNHIRDRAESQTLQAVATAADSKTR